MNSVMKFIFLGFVALVLFGCDAWDYGEHPQTTAIKKISEYADSNDTKKAPDLDLYKKAGIKIDSDDINATNEYIRTLSSEDVDTHDEIQDVVDNIDKYTNEKPIAKISVQSATVEVGQLVLLDGIESTDSDGEIVSYQWKQEGKLVHSGLAYDANLPIGRHIIELVVADNYGATGNDFISVVVKDPDSNVTTPEPDNVLKAVITTENNDSNNSSVTLSGSSSTYNQRTTKFEWKENNSVVKTGSTYTVTEAGEHTITLLLTDQNKTDSTTKTVTIR